MERSLTAIRSAGSIWIEITKLMDWSWRCTELATTVTGSEHIRLPCVGLRESYGVCLRNISCQNLSKWIVLCVWVNERDRAAMLFLSSSLPYLQDMLPIAQPDVQSFVYERKREGGLQLKGAEVMRKACRITHRKSHSDEGFLWFAYLFFKKWVSWAGKLPPGISKERTAFIWRAVNL
jgi:hypothetical protein